MGRSTCREGGSLLLLFTCCQAVLRIPTTFAAAAAGHSIFFSNDDLYDTHPRFKRLTSADPSFPYPLVKSSSLTSDSRADVPFDVSSTGVSRTLYPFYKSTAVFPSTSGYSVPAGAVPLAARSYSNNGNSGISSAYNPSYSSNYGSLSAVNNYSPSALSSNQQPSQRSLSPYASYPSSANNYNNYYPSNSYGTNYNNYYPSSSYASNINNYSPPNSYGTNNYNAPSTVNNANGNTAGNYVSSILSFRSADPAEPEDPGSESSVQIAPLSSRSLPSPVMPSSAQQFAAQSLAASTSVASDAVARGLGGSSGSGIGSGYASATPDGASQIGSPGYAQSSPNTASGSLYTPKYGSAPRFYGSAASGGVPSSPALLYPYFLYYPVQYGYDQGEQSVMPNGGIFPLIGYKRRYGYRNGPYYGYGIYVDYPPYFGFGKVKDGFGYDPEADLMASVALDQGSGASAALSINAASSGHQGYAQSGNPGYGSTGYGAPASPGYGAAPAPSAYGGSYGSPNTGTSYGNSGQSPYAANPSPYTSQITGYSPSQSQYGSPNYGQSSNTYGGRNYSPSSGATGSSSAGYGSASSFPGLTAATIPKKYAGSSVPISSV